MLVAPKPVDPQPFNCYRSATLRHSISQPPPNKFLIEMPVPKLLHRPHVRSQTLNPTVKFSLELQLLQRSWNYCQEPRLYCHYSGSVVIMGDVGVKAKELSICEVEKLLPLPELLASISSIKLDSLSSQQVIDAQLSAIIAEQVEQAYAGIDAQRSLLRRAAQLASVHV